MTKEGLANAIKEKHHRPTRIGMMAMHTDDVSSIILDTLHGRTGWTKEQLQRIAFMAASLAEDMDRDEEGPEN